MREVPYYTCVASDLFAGKDNEAYAVRMETLHAHFKPLSHGTPPLFGSVYVRGSSERVSSSTDWFIRSSNFRRLCHGQMEGKECEIEVTGSGLSSLIVAFRSFFSVPHFFVVLCGDKVRNGWQKKGGIYGWLISQCSLSVGVYFRSNIRSKHVGIEGLGQSKARLALNG